MAGAPQGNQNATGKQQANPRAKVWAAAINRALLKRSRSDRLEALDELAEKLLDKCAEGDLPSLKELGDRLDGKPHQSTDISNPDGSSLLTGIKVIFVEPGSRVPGEA